MNRRDDRDLEKPHFYSQYWIDQAREAAGLVVSVSDDQATATQVLDRFDSTTDDEPIAPHIPKAPPTLTTPLDEFDDLPLPPAPKSAKQKPPTHPQRERLTNLADLAALGFGAGAETDELAISPDDDADDIISQLESEFDMGRVEPDDEEAASFETLSEEENEMWDDEEEEGDGDGSPRAPRGKPSSPRRPRRDF